jgi:hypothetical protein
MNMKICRYWVDLLTPRASYKTRLTKSKVEIFLISHPFSDSTYQIHITYNMRGEAYIMDNKNSYLREFITNILD